ncbi:MAG: hypothetical protein CVU56_25420 [Deltaproteobacteria bacterium HGW-Deltaproteobacteria-14]|jgi:hypothetical protein|nr:MAG: hypothetical protein CVU56_25420 [Deltaproteobacteria bacterium HGW-Deltaproteobacteria-14]
MWHRLLLYLGVALAIQSPAPSGAATPDDDAAVVTFNARVDDAIALRDAGDDAGALAAFDEALRAIRDRSGPVFDKGRGVVRYHEAQLLVALERYGEARAMLTLLRDSPGLEPAERDTVAARLAEVEATLASQAAARPGRLRITAVGVPADVHVAVAVAGVTVGRAPVAIERPAGRYPVELNAEGYLPARDEVALAAGAEVSRTLRLLPVDADATLEIAGWTTFGAGLALLVGAAALHLDAAAELDRATAEGIPYATALTHRNTGRDEATAAYVMYGVGAAASVAGLVLLVVDAGDAPARAELNGVNVGVGPGTVVVGGRF